MDRGIEESVVEKEVRILNELFSKNGRKGNTETNHAQQVRRCIVVI